MDKIINKLSQMFDRLLLGGSATTLKDIYEQHNYVGAKKLYKLAKQTGLKITHKQVNAFLKGEPINQTFTIRTKPNGHMVSLFPDYKYMMDLIDMDKFKQQNKGNKFIYMFIDVFSRKVFCFPIKDNSTENIYPVLKEFINNHPMSHLVSDNESAFMSKEVQKLLDDNGIRHTTADVHDHRVLGVIDSNIQTIKRAIYKYMKAKNTTKYIDKLDEIVNAFNNTPHSGIYNYTPDDVKKPEVRDIIQGLNYKRLQDNINIRKDFVVGSFVRIRKPKTKFDRAFEPKYFDEVYQIKSIEGTYATLEDGDRVNLRRLRLAQAPSEEPDEEKEDELQKAKDQATHKKRMERQGIAMAEPEPAPSRPTRERKQVQVLNVAPEEKKKRAPPKKKVAEIEAITGHRGTGKDLEFEVKWKDEKQYTAQQLKEFRWLPFSSFVFKDAAGNNTVTDIVADYMEEHRIRYPRGF